MTNLTTLHRAIETGILDGTHDADLTTLLNLIGQRQEALADSDSRVCLLPSDLRYWRALSRDELAAKCIGFAVDTDRVADAIAKEAKKYDKEAKLLNGMDKNGRGQMCAAATEKRDIATTLSRDASDMKQIASCMSEGDLASAYHAATTVDTDVREQIPQKAWNVLYVVGSKLHAERMLTQC